MQQHERGGDGHQVNSWGTGHIRKQREIASHIGTHCEEGEPKLDPYREQIKSIIETQDLSTVKILKNIKGRDTLADTQ